MRPIALTPLLALVWSCNLAAEAGDDAGRERAQREHLPLVAMYVAQALESYHYARRPIDDEISSRWLDKYIERLDYNRLYFTRGDIDAFERYRTTLDDTLEGRGGPDLSPARHIHDRFVQRLRERVAFAEQVLAGPMDLASEDTVQLDREDAPWAADTAELDVLWERRLREEVLRLRLGGKSEDEAKEIVGKRYARYLRDVETEPDIDVIERYLTALAASFDPHSAWFAPATHDNFDIEMSDSVEGIGAELQTDGDYTRIVRTIPGGPADASGLLKPQDRILAVAQDGEEPVDIVGERIDDVVRLIRGPKGTTVHLTIWPADATDPGDTRVVSLVRDKVKLERAAASVEIHPIPDRGDALEVAVIEVPAFYVDWSLSPDHPDYRSASTDVERLLAELPPTVDAVVIDLRTNGGGSLDEAIALTGLFIDQGPVVQTRDARGEVEVLADTDPGVAWDGPLAVLTSVYSASASEIFAAAIQDYRRGLIVGAETTHGKGTVQNVFDLGRLLSRTLGRERAEAVGGALKYTTQKFYRVNGGSTQHRGVHPDIVLPSPSDGFDIREADLDYALEYDEIAPVALAGRFRLDADVDALAAASAARIAESQAFRFMAEDKARRAARMEQPLVLDLEARRAELDRNEAERRARLEALGITPCPEIDADADADGADTDADGADADAEEAPCEVTEPDPVLDETLAIVGDWLQMSGRDADVSATTPPRPRGHRRERSRRAPVAPGP